MTGFDIYELAMLLLGYIDEHAATLPDKAVQKRAIAAINQITLDIGNATPIINLSQVVTEDERAMEVIPYGVAMLLALSEGDSHKNVVFTAIYNARRTVAKREMHHIQDILPGPEVSA